MNEANTTIGCASITHTLGYVVEGGQTASLTRDYRQAPTLLVLHCAVPLRTK